MWSCLRATKSCREAVGLLLQSLITSELDWDEWSASSPGHFSPEETARNNLWTGVWVDFTDGQDHMDKRNISSACRRTAHILVTMLTALSSYTSYELVICWAVCDQYVVKVLCMFWWCFISYPTFLMPTYFSQTLVHKRSQLRVFCTFSYLDYPRSFVNKYTACTHNNSTLVS